MCVPFLSVDVDQQRAHHVFVQAQLPLELFRGRRLAFELHDDIVTFPDVVDLIGQPALAHLLDLTDQLAAVVLENLGHLIDFHVDLSLLQGRAHNISYFVVSRHWSFPLRTSPRAETNGPSRGSGSCASTAPHESPGRFTCRKNSPTISRRFQKQQGSPREIQAPTPRRGTNPADCRRRAQASCRPPKPESPLCPTATTKPPQSPSSPSLGALRSPCSRWRSSSSVFLRFRVCRSTYSRPFSRPSFR